MSLRATLRGTLAFALITLVCFEAAGRLFLALRPAYDVLFLEPDPVLGWKLVPDFRFTWTGVGWYASEFSVPIETNRFGFRDAPRSLEKPAGTTRIAVLGDSFVEALQVPFEQTAAQVLERRLETDERPVEVLNFGVSNFGVGQLLLAWEGHARRFAPDRVVAFVARLHMNRTVRPFRVGAYASSRKRRLRIRPGFDLVDGQLVRTPPRDYDAFVQTQREVMDLHFAGGRIRTRETSVVRHLLRPWWPGSSVLRQGPGPGRLDPASRMGPERVLALNLRILEDLGLSVEGAGGRFLIADADAHFTFGKLRISEDLRALCARRGFGYADVGQALRRASRSGSVHWRRDRHFNARGNEVFADTVAERLRDGLRQSAAGRD